MILSPYRLRLKFRHLQREHPVFSVIGFVLNVTASFAVVILTSAALYLLLTVIRPL
jgi:hypothetical protein